MAVNDPRLDYNELLPKWQRLRDCYNGRDAVLKAGAKYVPELPGADTAQNKAYRERGNYYNALARTVGGMNGAIFQEAPEVEMPESMRALLKDITLTNVPFESFVTEVGKEVFLTGRHGVLIDMPVQPKEGVQRASVDMRPYCVNYNAEDIINWRTERRGGDSVLTMIVLHEHVEVPIDGDEFTCNIVSQYRVISLKDGRCVQQLWRPKTEGATQQEYVKFEGELPIMRRGEALTFMPFIFVGALHSAPTLELPPLIDLADILLGHWRNSVDHEYGLHLVALPTPWMSGAKGGDAGPKKMGPSVVWELDLQGSAGMIEFTGAGLESLVVAMDEKKKQMATIGARLLEDAPIVGETMGAVKLRHSGDTANLRTVAQNLEMSFTQVLQICLWWQGTENAPKDVAVSVELNKEYLNVRATPQEIQVALTALQSGEMSFDTRYNLLVTGGWAREGIDAEQERKDIDTRKVDVTEPTAPPPTDEE